MTHRQRAGLIVIGVALILVAVIANLRPHLIPGAAQAAPVPGPPAVGDCVLDPLPRPQPRTPVAEGGTVPSYPAQQIRPCSGSRYGEITSVIATPGPTVVRGAAGNRYLEDPNLDSCYLSAERYLGVAAPPVYGFWTVSLLSTSSLSKPSTRQQAAGQRWAACIVAPPPTIAESGIPADQQYGSSIRDAVRTGRQRNQLAVCMPTLRWHGELTAGDCGRPHALEIVAFGDSGDHPVTRAQLELTCQQLVRQVTAMPDPTASGALSIQILVEDGSSTAITTAQIATHSNLFCGVTTTGTRKLRGSLLALGRQPIPWA